MRKLISLPVLLFIIAAVSAQAQNPDIFVTPIPANPFTGTVNVERSFVQKDGQIVQSKTAREIGRDSRGRIFNQISYLALSSAMSRRKLWASIFMIRKRGPALWSMTASIPFANLL